jgi:hypothetical protein
MGGIEDEARIAPLTGRLAVFLLQIRARVGSSGAFGRSSVRTESLFRRKAPRSKSPVPARVREPGSGTRVQIRIHTCEGGAGTSGLHASATSTEAIAEISGIVLRRQQRRAVEETHPKVTRAEKISEAAASGKQQSVHRACGC